jgi:hypothetical protein
VLDGADLLPGVPAVAESAMTVAGPVLLGLFCIERLRLQGTAVESGTTDEEVTVTND